LDDIRPRGDARADIVVLGMNRFRRWRDKGASDCF
jgi:hypothetical protein